MDPVRRRALGLLAAGALARAADASPGAPPPASAGAAADGSNASPGRGPARFASGVRVGEDRHALVVVDAEGRVLREDPLPGRAHGAAAHAGRGLSAVFARRPGDWFALFDTAGDGAVRRVPVPASRRAGGHGAFSADGRWLHVVENDFDAARGTLAVHDLADRRAPRRVAEIPTGGVGPHDLLRVPGTDLYLVANGGIATHPDTGREKLNLADMRPNVALVRAAPGRRAERLARWRLPETWHRVSLRHLALDGAGRLWVGGQDEREPAERAGARAPLVATAELADATAAPRRGAGTAPPPHSLALDPVDLPEDAHRALGGYVSSIDASGGAVAVTSSRGGSALLLDARSRTLRARLALGDCSGVAATDEPELGWRLTNGRGEFVACDALGIEPRSVHRFAWDNHLTRIA